MITVGQLYERLNREIPEGLSCPWDNDGMMVCPDKFKTVGKVLLTLDITAEAVEYAVENGFDVIISHHPLIFRPLKNLSGDDGVSAKVISLVKGEVAAFSFHTRLDALDGGVNDSLALLLGLNDITPFGSEGEEIGRIGYLDRPIDTDDFIMIIKEQLYAPSVNVVNAGLEVSKVAVCGGDGKDFLKAAFLEGADTYVTGTLSYNDMVDARELPMNVICAGHFYTENHILDVLSDMVSGIDGSIRISRFVSNPVVNC